MSETDTIERIELKSNDKPEPMTHFEISGIEERRWVKKRRNAVGIRAQFVRGMYSDIHDD